jgi:hypothetical protein
LYIKGIRTIDMINLSPGEWPKVERWVTEELDKVRKKNDAIGLTADETAAYRGEIRLLKRILDLPKAATLGVGAPPRSD